MRNRISLIVVSTLISITLFAQIDKLEIQINGMVCSLCTRSVQKSLEKLSFVAKVDADLETLRTIVTLREKQPISFMDLAEAVERAGFSIGELHIYLRQPPGSLISKNCIDLEEGFILSIEDKIDWSKTQHVRVINREFISPEEYKQWGSKITSKCGDNEQVLLVSSSL